MIVVITKFMAKPGMASDFKNTWLPVAEKSRKEASCLSYQLGQDMKNENSLYTIGTWKDEAALHEHMTSPFITDGIAQVSSLLAEEPEWIFCQEVQ